MDEPFICHVASVTPLFISVSAQRCPNATFTISCNITTPGPVTRWVVPPGYCASNDITLLQSSGTNCGSKNDSCGPFVATNLVPPSGMACTTSVLSVVAAPQLNGTNISCYSNKTLQYQHIISITSKLKTKCMCVRTCILHVCVCVCVCVCVYACVHRRMYGWLCVKYYPGFNLTSLILTLHYID